MIGGLGLYLLYQSISPTDMPIANVPGKVCANRSRVRCGLLGLTARMGSKKLGIGSQLA